MHYIVKFVSWISLIALILPSLLFLVGKIELSQVRQVMLIATIVWIVSGTLWMNGPMNRRKPEQS